MVDCSRMSINFLHPCFQPEITCDAVATEGYEISNLTSSNQPLADKGFLAERFISGPVEIKLKLICPIDVHRIVIWTKVSNQKSLGIELSAQKYSFSDEDVQLKRFASVVIPDHVAGVVFEREGQKTPSIVDDLTSSFHRCTFYRGKNYENVNGLLVKIFKFQYVAAMKRIEVWGRPNRSCDRQIKTYVYRTWNKSQRKHETAIEVSTYTDANSKSSETACHVPSDSIPEEFCDEITREIMTLPMILPSGKIVDYLTLEKFQKEEAKWGRPPSDPFTGLSFTAQRKPVVATSLKLNIDSFCGRNSNLNDVKTLPRRVGSRDEYDNGGIRISELVDKGRPHKRQLQTFSYYAEDGCNTNDAFYSDGQNTAMKRPRFTSFLNAPKPDESSPKTCLQCTTSTISNLYKLPCSHIICRFCITNCGNECRKCRRSFSFGDVEKIHIFQHV